MEEAKTVNVQETSLEERFAHSQALVLKAVNAKPGMMYTQIRDYIEWHYHVKISNIGARCRELYGLNLARKVEDRRGRVHVYPVKEVEKE